MRGARSAGRPSGGGGWFGWGWLRAALPLAALAGVALAMALAAPSVRAADPSPAPPAPGKHIVDDAEVLSPRSLTTAEALAAHIETFGDGKVAVYTTTDFGADTSDLASAWGADGLFISYDGAFGNMEIGPKLKAALSSDAQSVLEMTSTGTSDEIEGWIMSTLARIDGFLSGNHVFDGSGLLDDSTRRDLEQKVRDLSGSIGATVYVDITVSPSDPASAAFFNGADLSSALENDFIIALAVSDSQIGGYIESHSDSVNYQTSSPWSNDTLSNQSPSGNDLRASLLDAVNAVGKPPFITMDTVLLIGFILVVVVFSVTAPFLWGPWLIGKMTGVAGPIKGGVPSDAVIQSIADTGVTVSMPSVGPEAPEYKLGLAVTPLGGGQPYLVEAKALVPRIYVPMVVPGARIGVVIDPANPQKVTVDFSRINQPSYGAFAPGGTASGAPAGMDLSFDASGNPNMAQLGAFASAVSQGQLPTHTGSAAQLLATGTHGTAVITTAMPMGKTVRQVNPSADPSTLDDPLWMFTVEVSLAGQAPFPAVFGHRVPRDKAASIGPGTKLAVAVDEADKNQEVAIDWDRSPISG